MRQKSEAKRAGQRSLIAIVLLQSLCISVLTRYSRQFQTGFRGDCCSVPISDLRDSADNVSSNPSN